MNDGLENLEQRVSELARAVAALDERLAALEGRGVVAVGSSPGGPPVPEVVGLDRAAAAEVTVATVLALIGRTCLVLGGAYLLRALTDAGTLPRAGGTLLGLAYAVVWLVLAYRLDTSRRELVAPFYGAATALIAFPLLWEATVRVKLLSPEWAAALTAAVTALALLVAWRRRIESLAWVITIAGLLATLLFQVAFGPAVPFGFYLAFLGIVTLWMGYTLDWIWLRWPVAFVADFTVAFMVADVTGIRPRDGAEAVMLLQLVLFGGYLVSIAARTLYRSRDVIPFEVVQMLALLIVAFGGAVQVMRATGSGAAGLGIAGLVVGVGSYAVAFAFVDWREGHWKNFVFYNSLAVVLVLAGIGLTVSSSLQPIVWAIAAVAAASLGNRYAAVALGSHSAVYIVAGGIVSGLLGHVIETFTASPGHPWAPLSVPAAIVLASAAVCSVIPVSTERQSWGRYSRLPKVVIVVTLLLGAGSAVIGLLVPALAGKPGTGADPAVVAAIRTVVLAAAVLLLAWAGGRGIFGEGRWLMYVVLVIASVKLLVEDFVSGRPATLVLSLAVFGAALIIAPRLVRRAPSQVS